MVVQGMVVHGMAVQGLHDLPWGHVWEGGRVEPIVEMVVQLLQSPLS